MNLAHKRFHLRVERRTAENHFLEAAAEGLDHPGADFLEHQLVQDRQADKHLVAVHDGLDLRLIDLLDDQRDRNDDVRVNLHKRLQDNLRAGYARQEMHVRADGKLKEHLEHQSVHMGGGQQRHHFRLAVHLGLGLFAGKTQVRPDIAVTEHHPLRKTGGPGRVVDERQFVGLVLVIADILFREPVGIERIKILLNGITDILHRRVARIDEAEVLDLYDDLQAGHIAFREPFPDDLVDKEHLRLAVVHQILDVSRLELVQNGDRDGPVGHRRQESHAPVGLVAGTNRHLVAFLQTALLKTEVQQLDAPRQFTVLERGALVIGQGVALPVLLEARFKEFVDGLEIHYFSNCRRMRPPSSHSALAGR